MTGDSGERVLVLGGNRFAGSKLVALLVASGAAVTMFNRSGTKVPGAVAMQGDRNRRADLARAFASKPNVVVDMCLYTGDQARLTIEFLEQVKCRYVVVSSAVVYSQDVPPPWDENSRLESAPWWGTYGTDKVNVELALAEATISNIVTLRPTYFIGAGDPDQRCQRIFNLAAKEQPIEVPGEGDALIHVVSVDDVASVLCEAVYGAQIGAFNVPGSPPLSVAEFTYACADCVNDQPKVRHVAVGDNDVIDANSWPFPNKPLLVSAARFDNAFEHRCRSAQSAIQLALETWRMRSEDS